jgi:hypothetical protein
MQSLFTQYTAAELVTVMLAAVLVMLLAVFAYRAWRHSRVSAEERERRRCARLVSMGKITDAMLVELREKLVFYSYAVRGVEYTASQDLTRFTPEAADFHGVSSMSVRYDPRNPADSIVMSEQWNGLRGASRMLPENHASH